MNITYKVETVDKVIEMSDYLEIGEKRPDRPSRPFKGFTYLSVDTIDSPYHAMNGKDPVCIVAYNKKIIVGIMFLTYFDNGDNQYWTLKYIDVNDDYKGNGIATNLYQILNQWASKHQYIIVGTKLSKEGRNAKLHKLRERLLKDTLNFKTETQYFKYKEKAMV